MAAKIAGHLLAPCGMLVLHSSLEAFDKTNPRNFAVNLSRIQTCAIALNMAELKELPPNASVATILPEILDTPEHRKMKPGTDGSQWDNCEHLAQLIKTWCAGESRPENKSFVTFEKASKKMTFPKYV